MMISSHPDNLRKQYRITKILGAGGESAAYLAEVCVKSPVYENQIRSYYEQILR